MGHHTPEDTEIDQVSPAPGGSYSTASLCPPIHRPSRGMRRLKGTVVVDVSESFNVDEYSAYFQLHHDSSGQVIVSQNHPCDPWMYYWMSWERCKDSTLVIFLSTLYRSIVLLTFLVSRARVGHLFVSAFFFLPSSLPKSALARVGTWILTSEENDLCIL